MQSTAKKNGVSNNGSTTKEPSSQQSKLEAFFCDELKDIYWAEKHLVKILPKMQAAATTKELKGAFGEHHTVTKEHVMRLEKVFEMMGIKAQAKKCDAMDGITKEGESIIADTEEGTMTRDVGLVLAAQKAEHYEIATYGGLAQLAETIGRKDVAEILHLTLTEEKEADQLLSSLAYTHINEAAYMESA